MSPPREVYLTRSEVARLIRAARRDARVRRHLPLFILLGFYTGRRKEAILGLQWQPNPDGGYVDLETGYIDFRPQGRAETAKRRGRLRAPERLLRFLRYARRRTNTHVLEYGPLREPVRDVKRSFASAAANAGLDPARVTPHVLRHTCVSHLAQSGLPLWEACAWVDVTVETGEKVYAHHDGRNDRVRDLLDKGGRARQRGA
ncbi:tyrosine-type recombinase/integrase [Niveispirillum sp.]